MSETQGIIEQAKVFKHDKKELWSFIIKDENQRIICVDSLIRHYSDPILSEKTFTIVRFNSEDGKKLVEVMIPNREIPTSLSDINIFEGKLALINFFHESV